MDRPEQKYASVLGQLVVQYTKPRDLVCDVFEGTLAVEIASMSI